MGRKNLKKKKKSITHCFWRHCIHVKRKSDILKRGLRLKFLWPERYELWYWKSLSSAQGNGLKVNLYHGIYHSEISGHWEQRKDKVSSPNQQILHRRLRIRTVLDNRLVLSKFWKKFLTDILKIYNYLKKIYTHTNYQVNVRLKYELKASRT